MKSTFNRFSMPIWVIVLLFAGGVLLGLTVSFIIAAGRPVHVPESIVTQDKSTAKTTPQNQAGESKPKPSPKQREAGEEASTVKENPPIQAAGSR